MKQITQHAYDVHETDQFWTAHNTDWVREQAWNDDEDDDDDVVPERAVVPPRAPVTKLKRPCFGGRCHLRIAGKH